MSTKHFSMNKGVCQANYNFKKSIIDLTEAEFIEEEFEDWHPNKLPRKRIITGNQGNSIRQQAPDNQQSNAPAKNTKRENEWQPALFLVTPYNEIYNMAVISDFP